MLYVKRIYMEWMQKEDVLEVLRQRTEAVILSKGMNIVVIAASLALVLSVPFAHSFFKIGSFQSRSVVKMNDGTSYPIYIEDDVMKPKAHGTCPKPVMHDLRWGCDYNTADRISCFNRHYAEHSGYWESTKFLKEVDRNSEITFYDSVTGKPLFIAPRGRTFEEFRKESESHGWPSFRDQEVVWENTRCLTNGETVSVDGTHLGHNLPDRKGNRYCINLVSIAGTPAGAAAEEKLRSDTA